MNRDEYLGERTAAPLSVASRTTRCETRALVTMVWTHDHVGLHLNAPKNINKKSSLLIAIIINTTILIGIIIINVVLLLL